MVPTAQSHLLSASSQLSPIETSVNVEELRRNRFRCGFDFSQSGGTFLGCVDRATIRDALVVARTLPFDPVEIIVEYVAHDGEKPGLEARALTKEMAARQRARHGP